MIKKEDLLKELEGALIAEEKSIPIYMKHLDLAIFWTGWDEQTIAKARSVFGNLAGESERHKVLVAGLIKKIKEDKRDAF
ncbi:MAG: hypothetical protein WC412_00520 [Candidatus Omnitrophota bacterium]|jgi:rubrerythrin